MLMKMAVRWHPTVGPSMAPAVEGRTPAHVIKTHVVRGPCVILSLPIYFYRVSYVVKRLVLRTVFGSGIIFLGRSQFGKCVYSAICGRTRFTAIVFEVLRDYNKDHPPESIDRRSFVQMSPHFYARTTAPSLHFA